MAQAALKLATGRRQAAKEQRRQQLIKATIKCVARRGFADTTMADVTREAGLSLGIVNLHFQSKEKLFIESLRYLSDEYETACSNALAKAGDNPANRLMALVELDFSSKVCERGKLAVWFAFWGEAKSRPTYSQICAAKDRRYAATVIGLCEEIVSEGRYTDADPGVVATGLTALTDGLWLDLMMTPNEMSREQAINVCLAFLHANFPRHFPKSR